jgi:hypothetical protein
MTLRSFTTWLLPLASIAFFTACGSRSFQGAGPQPCQGAACGAGSCTVDGYRYQDGVRGIPAGDGCNTCSCDDGQAACTVMACNTAGNGSGGGPSGCEVDGEPVSNGAADIAAPDGCNTCSCVNGDLVCTDIACPSTFCTYNGTFYDDGDSFPAIDGCNTCTCVEGAVSCTEIGCVDPGGCTSGADCDMGEMCQFAEGSCGGTGSCVATLVDCDLSYVPVCGCDGVTYGNACGAQSAGANVSYAGECGTPVTYCGGAQCGDNQFCQYPEGYCVGTVRPVPAGDQAGAPVPVDPGVCTDLPDACGEIYSPVCGCDGVTYDNPCSASAAGMNVATTGACPTVCFDNTGCAMGEYCMYADGLCGGGPYPPVAALAPGGVAAPLLVAPTGTCQAIPEACTADEAPVCGCDGMTYSNACGAAAAGMSVSYAGECTTVVPL